MPDISSTYGDDALTGGLTPTTTYYLSLHTADPGTTGANEVSGGTYARQVIQFGNPSANSQASTDAQTFTGMPSEAGNLYAGIWTASTSGTYLIGAASVAVTGPVAAGASITFAIGAVTVAAS